MSQPDTASLLASGRELHALASELYPICRSITGDGVRQTLARLQEVIPLQVVEVPTGTQVFDWVVPKEWNIRRAYIKNSRGETIVDFSQHSLHVVSYSIPFRGRLRLAELRPHLHSLPDRPDWIPYRTSYYKPDWGFCLPHRKLQELEEDEYEVVVESTLEEGHLTYGECYLPGEVSQEVLISAHICHPSLANDNLSGVVVAAYLARALASKPRRYYSYRFLFIPGTIGSITWLSLHQEDVHRIRHGLVLTCLGDAAPFTYKRSRRGNAEIDRVFSLLLRQAGLEHRIRDFSPYGYDERQYCSPGFNLPVGCLMRSVHGEFPEYHTSADNLDFILAPKLEESLQLCWKAVHILEHNLAYQNLNPFCEPQLGKRGLYRSTGGPTLASENLALLWVLNLSDGTHRLLDIAERSGLPFELIHRAAQQLVEAGLLVPIAQPGEALPSREGAS